MATNKEKYRVYCQEERGLPLFLMSWWLDAVCIEGGWDVAVVEEGGRIKGVMPYYLVKGRLGHRYLTMPHLTPFLGPWLNYPLGQKEAGKIAFERETIQGLIEQLPGFDSFSQGFHFSFKNGLPFYWRGFRLSPGYTYVIEDLSDLDRVFKNLKSNIRWDIRKAAKELKIIMDSDKEPRIGKPIEKLYEMICLSYVRQGRSFPYPFALVERLDAAAVAAESRRIFFAVDQDNRVHAAVYIVWDQSSAYYLLSGGDPGLRNSGATSFLLWEAIQYAAKVTRSFDFEGSMIQPIEHFFSAFGTVQRSYLQVEKTNSRFLMFKQFFREFRRL